MDRKVGDDIIGEERLQLDEDCNYGDLLVNNWDDEIYNLAIPEVVYNLIQNNGYIKIDGGWNDKW